MARPKGVSANKELRKEIAELRLNGAKLQEISDTFNLALATVHRICEEEEVKKPKGKVEQNLEAILDKINSGLYLNQISTELGISYNCLWRYLKERDYPINYQRRRA